VDFRLQSVQVQSVDASTRQTHLLAQGRLSANSDLQLNLTTLKLAELEPLVTSWRGIRARELPIEFGGSAEFRGTVRGRLNSPALAGYLELHDFTTVLRTRKEPESGAAPVERVVRTRWELLQGGVEYSAARESIHHGLLRRGGARIQVDASVALVDGNYDGTQPFSAHVKVDNVEAGELQALVGSSYPVTGKVSGDVQVEGTEYNLHGDGRIQVQDGTAWRQAVRWATAEVNFTRNQAELRNILVKSDAMQLRGDARLNVETREFGFDLRGTEVKIENLRVVREGKIKASGQAVFEANGGGTLGAPRINGRLRLRNLAVNRQPLGDMDVDAVTHGAEMTLTAHSNSKVAKVKLTGEVLLRGQMPMHLSADVESANLYPLLEAFVPLHHGAVLEMKMHLDVKGEALRPRNLTAELVVEHWVANYGGIVMAANDGPVRLTMANQVVRVEQFRLAGEQGTRFLQLRGEIELGGKRQIDLHADGSLNLKLLETADPDLTAGGVADLNLRINGTLSRPSLRGSLKVRNATITNQDFSNGLSEITGTLIFNQDRLQVQELTARTGGGLLRFEGFLTFSLPQGLFFNLTASGREIRLRYPDGVSSTVDAAFALTGTRRNALLSGDVTVTRLGLNPQFDFGAYLAAGVRGTVQKIGSPLNNLRLDVHVTSTPQLQLQTAAARLSGNLDLRLRGTALRPMVLGRINLLDGTIDFNGTKYKIERGGLTFTNPVRIEPALDIELSTRVRDYDLTLDFHGPMSKMNSSYRSDPPLSSTDIISLLALGGTAGESMNPARMGTSQYQPSVSAGSSSALIGQALNATMSSRAQRLFGVSRVKIDPNVGEALNSGLARVTVEQQISNRLTLIYISSLNQTAQQIIQFEYNLDKGVSIVGVRDQTGVVSFEVLLRKRRK
jgi:translocation and assembly module TamB